MDTLYGKQLPNKDVQIYAHKDVTGLKCTFPWLTTKPPRKNAKHVYINCNRYNLEWI